MPLDDPAIKQVPVKRYDINVTLQQIVTPLTQIGAVGAAAPEVEPHLAQLREFAGNLQSVADRIDAIDAKVLSPKRE